MPAIGSLAPMVVLAIALIVLGPRRLPDAGRSLGRGLREFKESVSGRDPDAAELAPPTAADRS
jgi:sec-independent protein translocase protein TatA